MSVLLLTGFEPYNGAETNPSGELARMLDGTSVGDVAIAARVLPVSAAHAPAALGGAIDETCPDAILMLGVWPGRHAFQIERIAVNVLDFPYPDNDGAQPVDEPVVDDGPVAYLSRVPVRAVLGAWAERGLPGIVSSSAGTYLCNQSFYLALHRTSDRELPVGFVHLPATLEASSRAVPPQPGLPLATLAEGVSAALEAVVHSALPTPRTATCDPR